MIGHRKYSAFDEGVVTFMKFLFILCVFLLNVGEDVYVTNWQFNSKK